MSGSLNAHNGLRSHRESPLPASQEPTISSPSLGGLSHFGSPAMQQQSLPSTSVQVLGMNLAQSQPLLRNSSSTSTSSTSHSSASTPYHQNEQAPARPHHPTPRDGSAQQATSLLANHATNDFQEELYNGSPPLDQDSSSSWYQPMTASFRKANLSHGARVLAHKDSFGGNQGLIDEHSLREPDTYHNNETSRFADRHAESEAAKVHRERTFSNQSDRKTSLSSLSTTSHNRTALTQPHELVEVLGQTVGTTPLELSHSTASLSAAAAAATVSPTSPTSSFEAQRMPPTSNHSLSNPSSTSALVKSPPTQIFEGADEAYSVARQQSPATGKRPPSKASSTLLESQKSELPRNCIPAPGSSAEDPRSAAAPAAREKRGKERDNRGDKNGSSRSKDAPLSSRSEAFGTHRTLKSAHRNLPQLPSASNIKPAPPPAMYWSKVPVHGTVPKRSFRAHTTSLSDEVLWLFGGCDNKGCFRDLWCFDTETMCWSKPKVTGDIPPARRAHTATMFNKRLFVFAGGDGPNYFNDLYVFDTISLRWSKPEVFGAPPSPRRAHTCNYYEGQLVVFGGGNGIGALNDVHLLDVTDISRLEWKKMECSGKIPIGRGYHTTNLVDGKLIVIGGSDGHMSFNDIHILRLDTKTWYQVKTDEIHNRLGHTATQVGSYLFVFGGHNSKAYTSELLTLNLVNLQWESRKVCGKKPLGRGYHQAWLRDSRLFVHGGFDGKDIFDDLHYLDLAACAYLPQITSFSVELDDV